MHSWLKSSGAIVVAGWTHAERWIAAHPRWALVAGLVALAVIAMGA